MLSKRTIYWSFQFSGWTILFSLSLINNQVDIDSIFKILSLSISGILISHLLRSIILKLNAIDFKFILQSIVVAGNSIIASIIFSVTQYLVYVYVFHSENVFFDLLSLLNISVYFAIWQIIYFIYVLREKSRQETLNNLHLEALNHEIELKILRSQLNPHFIFNALNSIRALVDENKDNAKNAVNLLSNVMRSILISEKQKMIPVSEELKLVSDYLQLEKIRFEERLNIELEVDKVLYNEKIPPLIIQTMVENAIKHGVANRVAQSTVRISSKNKENYYEICVENDVSIQKTEKGKSTNTGLDNLRKRLEIIYNKKAKFLFEIDEKAKAIIQIPKNYESNNSR